MIMGLFGKKKYEKNMTRDNQFLKSYAIKVNGDSMSPEIPNGSHILLKRINEEQFVEWGKIFCLDTANGAVIKKIFPTDDPEVIECRSINPEFPSFKVNTKHINGWYRVLMVMSFK